MLNGESKPPFRSVIGVPIQAWSIFPSDWSIWFTSFCRLPTWFT